MFAVSVVLSCPASFGQRHCMVDGACLASPWRGVMEGKHRQPHFFLFFTSLLNRFHAITRLMIGLVGIRLLRTIHATAITYVVVQHS